MIPQRVGHRKEERRPESRLHPGGHTECWSPSEDADKHQKEGATESRATSFPLGQHEVLSVFEGEQGDWVLGQIALWCMAFWAAGELQKYKKRPTARERQSPSALGKGGFIFLVSTPWSQRSGMEEDNGLLFLSSLLKSKRFFEAKTAWCRASTSGPVETFFSREIAF